MSEVSPAAIASELIYSFFTGKNFRVVFDVSGCLECLGRLGVVRCRGIPLLPITPIHPTPYCGVFCTVDGHCSMSRTT